MAQHSASSIIRDGLVFHYDMNSRQSYRGRPTTNMFGGLLAATNATRTITAGEYAGEYNGWEYAGNANDNPRVVLYNGSMAVSASTYYTVSLLYWSSNNILDDVYIKFADTGWPESTYYIQPFTSQSETRNGNYTVTDLGGGWKRCVGTFQTLATTTTLNQIFFDVDVAGVVVFVTNVQLEQNTTVSRYTSSSRINTQTLYDYIGGHTITATSLTYNADDTFSFNGSSDVISLDGPVSTILSNFASGQLTLDVWCKIPSAATWTNGYYGSILSRGSYAGNVGIYRTTTNNEVCIYFRQSGATFGAVEIKTTVDRDTWFNITSVWNMGTASLYKNGVLVNNASGSLGTATTGAWSIGNNNAASGAAGNRFTGSASAVKIYDRALSATEIKQNFTALRGRYGV